MTELPPILNSENRELIPDKDIPKKMGGGLWLIPAWVNCKLGTMTVSYEYLKKHRMYHLDEYGRWTQPKGGGSFTSLETRGWTD